MTAEKNQKAKAWALFDRIVEQAALGGKHSNPWKKDTNGALKFVPDYATLEQLLGVPLELKASTQSGVPALALDVWLSYELRRAGFEMDQIWPRPVHPRVLPAVVAKLVASLPLELRKQIEDRIKKNKSISGVTASSANILGKNYLKQVDVIMTDGRTGPELLISTKRMDSSYGKNAPNRVEESYGDAKNLRLRHPLAALGFVFGLRSDILTKEPNTADWIFDLLIKLGQEDDAYHATCLVLMEYGEDLALPDADQEPAPASIEDVVLDAESSDEALPAELPEAEADNAISALPRVRLLLDKTPEELLPDRFLAAMVSRVLTATPVNMHTEARNRRSAATPGT